MTTHTNHKKAEQIANALMSTLREIHHGGEISYTQLVRSIERELDWIQKQEEVETPKEHSPEKWPQQDPGIDY